MKYVKYFNFLLDIDHYFFHVGDTYPGFDTFYKDLIHNHLRAVVHNIIRQSNV
jgi:hypothetical protein